MNLKNLAIFIGTPIIVIFLAVVIVNDPKLGQSEVQRMTDIAQKDSQNQNQIPTDTETLQLFYGALSEKNTTLALAIMNRDTLGDEQSQKAWKEQFESFDSIKLKTFDIVSDKSDGNKKLYKVTLEVKPSDKSKDAIIPYYGYSNGDNIRWVMLEKGNDNLWRVKEIATGE